MRSLLPCNHGRAQEEEDISSFPAEAWPAHSHRLSSTDPTSLFPIEALSSPRCAGTPHGSPWWQILNCTSLLTPNNPIFAGEIPGSLFKAITFLLPTGAREGSRARLVLQPRFPGNTHSEGQCRQWSAVCYTSGAKAESPLSQGPWPVFMKTLYTLSEHAQIHLPSFPETSLNKGKERHNQS